MLKGLGSLFGLQNSNENKLEEDNFDQPGSDREIQQNGLNVGGDGKEEFFQQVIQQEGLSGEIFLVLDRPVDLYLTCIRTFFLAVRHHLSSSLAYFY